MAAITKNQFLFSNDQYFYLSVHDFTSNFDGDKVCQ
jgi:hypothetical protein